MGAPAGPAWNRTLTSEQAAARAGERLPSVWGGISRLSGPAIEVTGLLLDPAGFIVLAMGIWRLSADLGWTKRFVIEKGLFSHWQVWIGLAVGLHAAARVCRYAAQATRQQAEAAAETSPAPQLEYEPAGQPPPEG